MRRTKPRTYQGKAWPSDRDMPAGDLAVSVDMRGGVESPQQRAKAQREVLEYLVNHPDERQFQERALLTLFGVTLDEAAF